MKHTNVIVFFLLIAFLAPSCVIDTFEFLFSISNSSDKRIRIYFSQNSAIDTSLLSKEYSIIDANSRYSVYKYDLIVEKKQYKLTGKKLYLFIFDNDIIDKHGENMEAVVKRAFLERKEIDIRHITPKDTVFYKDEKTN